MFIDLVAFILLCLALFKGWKRGLVVALFSFLAFVIGIAAALKLSTVAAGYLGQTFSVSKRWLPVLAFMAVFLVVVILIRLGAKLIEGAMQLVMLGWLNRLGGILFYALIYFFIFSTLLFYATQLHLIKQATTEASVSYPFIQPIGPKIMDIIGRVFPFLRNLFEDLLRFFDQSSVQKPEVP